MNKKSKKIWFIVIILILSVLAIKLFYINVDGSFLSNFIAENNITEITILKEKINGEIVEEITLTEQQIEKLKYLFDNTGFERNFSSIVEVQDKNIYRIISITDNGEKFLHIEAQGQDFVVVRLTNQVDKPFNQTLQIKNGKWQAVIEDIIAG